MRGGAAEEREHAEEDLGEGMVDDGEMGEALRRREGGEPLEDGGPVGGWGRVRAERGGFVKRDVGREGVDDFLGVHRGGYRGG